MNHSLHLTPVAVATALLLAACSSMPVTTPMLSQDHVDYQAAQASADVARYAPLELRVAGDALALADASAARADRTEEIDRLAYLAKVKIALAQEAAKQKGAEADVVAAGRQRDQMRLAQRTAEADRSRALADSATARADSARAMADQSNQRTAAAIDEAADAQRKAAEARHDTADARADTARLEAQLAELAAKKTERGIVITLGDVLFATDVATLNPQGQQAARRLAEVLQQNPGRNVSIEGFTDSTGSAEYNQALSERRADAVSAELALRGIARERIVAHGYGESHPVAANDTAGNRQLNRRVEIVLSDDNGKVGGR